MIVRATKDSLKGVPRKFMYSGMSERTRVRLTIGQQYLVCALIVFEGAHLAMVLDDEGDLATLPTVLFEVVDDQRPGDWVYLRTKAEPSEVTGPSVIAASLAAYERLINADPDSVQGMHAWIRGQEP